MLIKDSLMGFLEMEKARKVLMTGKRRAYRLVSGNCHRWRALVGWDERGKSLSLSLENWSCQAAGQSLRNHDDSGVGVAWQSDGTCRLITGCFSDSDCLRSLIVVIVE